MSVWVLTLSGVCLQVRVYFFGLDTEALLHTYATVPFGYAMSLAGLCKVCARDFFFHNLLCWQSEFLKLPVYMSTSLHGQSRNPNPK